MRAYIEIYLLLNIKNKYNQLVIEYILCISILAYIRCSIEFRDSIIRHVYYDMHIPYCEITMHLPTSYQCGVTAMTFGYTVSNYLVVYIYFDIFIQFLLNACHLSSKPQSDSFCISKVKSKKSKV